MLATIFSAICLLFLLLLLTRFCCASLLEHRLYEKLLSNSNKLVRPVANANDTVQVTMKLFLQQIALLDDRNQVIELNAWLEYKWNDYRLVWNRSEYKQIDSVRFRSDMIWHPDILLYNSGDENFDSTYKSQILVYNNGDVTWIPPGIFRTSCKIDITWFPFDDQSCYLKFGSWTYNGLALNLKTDTKEGEEPSMDLSDYTPSGEWTVKNTVAKRQEIFYECCPEPYYSIEFYLNIRRRTVYYGFNVIIPSLLVTMLTTLAFTLPPIDLSEKIGFQTMVISTVCFFLIYVSQITPLTSEAVSLLVYLRIPFNKGVFFSMSTLLVASSTTFTITVLNVRYRLPENHQMGPLIHTVFLDFLPRLLRMKDPQHVHSEPTAVNEDSALKQRPSRSPILQLERYNSLRRALLSAGFEDGIPRTLAVKVHDIPAQHLFLPQKVGQGLFDSTQSVRRERRRDAQCQKLIKECMAKLANPESDEYNEKELAVTKHYAAMYSKLKYISKRMRKKKLKSDIKVNLPEMDDWKFAAMVLDRWCLLVFSVFLIISTIGIFTSAPYLHA